MSDLMFRHPFARLGLRAGAVLRNRTDPAQLSTDDGHELIETIVGSVLATRECRAGEPGWAWYLTLAACYPNSPATHHSSRRAERQEQERRVRVQFAPDDSGDRPGLPCASCQTCQTTVRWGKPRIPLAAPEDVINNQAPGGQPWCWWCRIGTWLLPFAAASNNRSMLTVTSVSSRLEQQIVAAYTAQAQCAVEQRWSSWDGIDPMAPLRHVLLGCSEQELAQVEWLWWRNDNREAEISGDRMLHERELRWWHRTWSRDEFRRGWDELLRGTRHQDPLLLLAHNRHKRGGKGKDAVVAAFENAWLTDDRLLVRGEKNRKTLHPGAGQTAQLVQNYLRHCRYGATTT